MAIVPYRYVLSFTPFTMKQVTPFSLLLYITCEEKTKVIPSEDEKTMRVDDLDAFACSLSATWFTWSDVVIKNVLNAGRENEAGDVGVMVDDIFFCTWYADEDGKAKVLFTIENILWLK